MAMLHNPHPGEILKAEFLDEIGLSQNRLAAERARIQAVFAQGSADEQALARWMAQLGL